MRQEDLNRERSYHLITLSARSAAAVRQAAGKLKRHAQGKKLLPLGDLAYTLHVGRKQFPHRLTLTASSEQELLELCELASELNWEEPQHAQGITYGDSSLSGTGRTAWLFTGQGAQYSGMGRELYESSRVVKRALDECAAILAPYDERPFLDYLFDPQFEAELNETHITQPALFALEYALAQLWMSWGIRPAVVMGHSLGEYVAACVAGALSLKEALLLVRERGQLMQELCERGSMVSVMATAERISPYLEGLGEEVSISAINSTEQVVVAGRTDMMVILCTEWERDGIVFKKLPVSHAFHSPLMEPMLEEFAKVVGNCALQPLQIPLVSNLTGHVIQAGETLDVQYWCQHLRQPVQFAAGLQSLLQQQVDVLLEVGPHPVLKRLADRVASPEQLVIGSLKRGVDGWKAIQDHLGQLWAQGVAVDWKAFDADFDRRRLHLPTYPFELKSFWLDVDRSLTGAWNAGASSAPSRATGSRSPERVESQSARSRDDLPSSSADLMATLWRDVLGVKRIGVDDDFFERGGDSLNVIQLQTRIREQTGAEFSFQDFFTHSTLRQMAMQLDALRGDVKQSAEEAEGAAVQPAGSVEQEIPVALAKKFYPLSHAQRRMWLLEQLQPGSATYNIPNAVRISGRLQAAALEKSLQEIVERHASLRTTFAEVDGEPVQIVHADMTVPLTVLEWQDGQGAGLDEQMREEAQRSFDLMAGPLLRATLLRLAEDEHVLLLTLHHIVSDGWSMGVLVRELSEAYVAGLLGRDAALPELPIQYPDYAEWQQEWLQDAAVTAQFDYWKQQLAGQLPILQLPTDRPRPAVQSYRGATHKFTLPASLVQRLERVGQQAGATLYMTLLAAFNTLLYRYTGQEDILIGSPTAGRNRRQLEPLIGMFVNTLVLRTNLSGDPTFRELLARVRQVALEANTHQDVPFEQLVGELVAERNQSYSPLFQTMFVLQNTPMPSFEQPGLRIEPMEVDSGTAKFDLTLSLMPTGEGLSGALEYNLDLFEAETIQRMAGHLERLLESIAEAGEEKISTLTMMSEAEREQVLVEWNRTATDYPREASIQQLFEEQVERRPDAVAVVYQDRQLTYGGLNRMANRMARLLQKAGVQAGQPVGLCMERTPNLIVSLLAIVKAGGAYVPLDPEYPEERLTYIMRDTGLSVLLTEEHLAAKLPVGGGTHELKVLCFDSAQDSAATESEDNLDVPFQSEQLAYIIYTSGSTGLPKGVCVPHRGVVRLVKGTSYVEFSERERFLQFAPISFDASTFEIWGCLLNGAQLVQYAGGAATLEELGRTIREQGVTTLWLTAGLFHQFVDHRVEDLKGVRQLLAGGDVISAPHVRKLLDVLDAADGTFLNGYGPTESTTFATVSAQSEPDQVGATVSIGRPIANTQVYVLDQRLQPVPIGVPGELYIGGDGLAQGYLNLPELTAERFVPHPFAEEAGARLYKTGDLVRYRGDGQIEFIGRTDFQVKIRGFRIELGEIETVLATHEAVRESVVIAREDVPGDKRLVAYIVLDGDAVDQALNDVKQFLREKLPAHMLPSFYVNLEALPLTANGKVDRRALPAPERQHTDATDSYVAPRTPVEELLSSIWADVLQVERVGVQDDFFELGGHSLLATQLISRVRLTFGVEVPMRALFDAPTIAGLLAHVEQRAQGESRQETPIPPAAQDGPSPLSYAQERMWFLDQFAPGAATYHIPVALRLQGELDTKSLERSLEEVIRRHPSLRTVFVTVDGQPVQRVQEHAEWALPVVELSASSAEERGTELQRQLAEEAKLPFDLSAGPLVRATLFKRDAEDHVLMLTMHHIISDGWSMGVLVREISALYSAFVQGGEATLPELPIQYADFASWQREWLQGETLAGQFAYWKETLAGELPVLQLPTDRPRPALQTMDGAVHRFTLPTALSSELKKLSRREGATLYMTLLAAFQTLLHRYTGAEDILIGSPIAGRNRAELEGLIGMFVNTLVLRTDLSGDLSFRELLERVRHVTLAAYEHPDLPFEKLVNELQPNREMSHSPLFQVMFDLQNTPLGDIQLTGLGTELLDVETGTAKFDMMLNMREEETGVSGVLEYNSHLFDASTISRMMEHFQTLLESIASQPEAKLSSLELLPAAERHLLLTEWNQTDYDHAEDICMHQMFEAQVDRTPDAIALVVGTESWSYRELNERANRLAHHLQSYGVGPDALVGVCMERKMELVVALLAVLKAGGAYVPLDPNYPADRIAFTLEDAQATVLLTQESLRSQLPQQEAPVLCLDSEWDANLPAGLANPTSPVAAHNLAYVIYTSGSTGRPKGVAIEHRNATVFMQWAHRVFTPEELAGVLFSTSICFDLSIFELFATLSRGGKVILAENALHLPTLPAADEVTLINTVPSAITELLRMGGIPRSVRTINLAGEPLSQALVDDLYQGTNVQNVYNLYGPSEDTTYSTYVRTQRGQKVTIGRPIDNTQVYLLDQHLQPVPIGVAGELHLGGAGLARGYLNRLELTAEKFIPNPFAADGNDRLYKTGDLARYLPDGSLDYMGRLDFQVKIRGFRIELGEIETKLLQHPAVQEVVVMAREHGTGDLRLVAYLVVDTQQELDSHALNDHLKDGLPEYMVPSLYMILERLPLSPNGKVDRRALPEPDWSKRDLRAEYVAPETEEQVRIAKMWSELLSIEQIGIHDHFFELGGHSLLATQLVSRIRQEFQVDLPLRKLFETPTVAEICKVITSSKREPVAAAAPKLVARSREARRVKQ